MRKTKRGLSYWVLLTGLVIGFCALLVVGRHFASEYPEDIAAFLRTYWAVDSAWSYVAIVLILVVATASWLIPLSVVAIVVGSICGIWVGFLCSVVGASLGALVAFLASRYWIRARLEERIRQRLSIARLDREVARLGTRFVFAIRLSPVAPFSLVSYAFGLTKVSTVEFMVGSLGALPGLFACVYSGAISKDLLLALTGNSPELEPMRLLLLVLGLCATIVSVAALWQVVRRSLADSGDRGGRRASSRSRTTGPAIRAQRLPDPAVDGLTGSDADR
jgi:uncharacterized membrane protein YdjX (TVP38/TMEM64 family)